MTAPTFRLVKKINIDRIRFAAGSYVNGRYVDATDSTISIEANVQPLPGEELINLPEAQRDSEAIQLFTTSDIKTASESDAKKADRVVYDGKTYEVHLVEKFIMGVQDHYRAVAIKVDE